MTAEGIDETVAERVNAPVNVANQDFRLQP